MILRPRNNNRPWCRIQNNAGETDIFIYDEISFWGISAQAFADRITAIDSETINLRINSPGGDVFDGFAIYNLLRQHEARVVTYVDGIAASIASIIALAGDEVRVAKNSFFMIHNPWTLAFGNASELREVADRLDKIRGSIADTYVDHSELDLETAVSAMDDETWYSAEEAVGIGLADSVIGESEEDTEAKNVFDLTSFRNTPKSLLNKQQKKKSKPSKREFETLLRDSGFSRSQAVAITAKAYNDSLSDSDDAVNAALNSLLSKISA